MILSVNGAKNHHNFSLEVIERPISQEDILNNSSTIDYTFTLSMITGNYIWDEWTNPKYTVNYTLIIGEQTIKGNIPSYMQKTPKVIKIGTINIPHELDGTKDIELSIDIKDTTGASYCPGNAHNNGSLTLTPLHKRPELTIGTIQELNSLLDNKLYNNLSQKRFNVSYNTYDGATITSGIFKVNGIAMSVPLTLGSSNYFYLDLKNNSLNKDYTNITITLSLIDSLGSISEEKTIIYDANNYINYQKPNIIQSSSNVKRNGQISGQVKLNLQSTFFNAKLNNNQNTPTLKFKYWKLGTSEPSNYIDIPSSAISINGNNANINSWVMKNGGTTITSFDKEYQYNVKVNISDTFNNSFETIFIVKLGEYIVAKFKDRVDFKKITENNKDIATKEYVDDREISIKEYVNNNFDKPFLKVKKSSGQQNFTAGTYTKVQLGNIEADTHNGFNTDTNEYTVQKTGLYLMCGECEFQISSGTRRLVNRIAVDGNNVIFGISSGVSSSGIVFCSNIMNLVEGQKIKLEAKIDGISSYINSGSITTYLMLKML